MAEAEEATAAAAASGNVSALGTSTTGLQLR